ncbi:MAG: phosphomannomutase/phosphoglucomutase [Syntrophomonadaceae bacterium]|nr:phosphomannomutase/phosphoglucomutase [Syntrophomonadaceae bacterium]
MKNIFRQYDIRGVVGVDLDDEMMFNIARAFATMALRTGYDTVILGQDNRLSSPHMHDIMLEALLQSGVDVIDLGVVITPVFYFAARHLGINAGIMITASHNPSEYNGCKLLLGNSTIYGEQIQAIRQMIKSNDYTHGPRSSVKHVDISEAYLNEIINRIKLNRKLKVALDCANGTASLFAPGIFRALGCEVLELYCDSDPTFPNHHPDPVDPENMTDLVELVKSSRADLGIGMDGDGDRIGVVDNQGNMIWGDLLMILFWREILPHYPGSDCIVEVKCSQALIDEINKLGGKPIIYKTGHSLIKSKMREIGAVFTGEMSGHMFFADEYYGFDDAVYASARLLRLLSRTSKSLSELLADVPQYYSTPELRIACADELKFDVVEQVREHFNKLYPIIDIDGARILFPGGWGLVRASNTGPELIVRCEGATPADLENIKNELFAYLQKTGLKSHIWHEEILVQV